MRFTFSAGIALMALSAAGASSAQTRFEGMDRNNDGTITRAEWRGNDRAFRNQDWNGDGVLSGDEVRPGARRQNWNQDWNRDGIVDNHDTQIAQRFRGYDMDTDGRVATIEWPGDQRLFARLDTNRDRYLTIQEYTTGAGFRLDSQGGPANVFSSVDSNRDGWVTRNEWNMGLADFNRLDSNSDNRISRYEFENVTSYSRDDPSSYYDRFATVDVNHDGWLTRSEWRGSETGFTRLDANRDNRLSRPEYDAHVPAATAPSGSTNRSDAWRTGYNRGLQEGRVAGREDVVGNRGWDLDGQRELERADSGYTQRVGSLSDYQAGYREGFRNAYREGFYSARKAQ
ncbi:MAG TPA: hypothetical protein VJM31_16970 [Vicinamibacterales bacterium]|nr:hypothetical protein [Vicinamibacterales bacterium]